MSKGRNRVGVPFNPSGHPLVYQYKHAIADLIDGLDEYANSDDPEVARVGKIAQDKLESACMWAVKTITKG